MPLLVTLLACCMWAPCPKELQLRHPCPGPVLLGPAVQGSAGVLQLTPCTSVLQRTLCADLCHLRVGCSTCSASLVLVKAEYQASSFMCPDTIIPLLLPLLATVGDKWLLHSQLQSTIHPCCCRWPPWMWSPCRRRLLRWLPSSQRWEQPMTQRAWRRLCRSDVLTSVREPSG